MQNLKRFIKNILVLMVIVTAMTMLSCDEGSDKKASSDSAPAVSAIIGPEGGMLNGPDGSKVSIPEGALMDTVTITIDVFLSNDDLPADWAPIPCFAGALDLGPDGTTFLKPVTITVPTGIDMVPGEVFPLLYWNEGLNQWEQTDNNAVVDSGGRSFTAQVTHFSGYGGGAFENLGNGGNAEQFKNDFSDWYNSTPAMPKIGQKRAKNNDCYSIVGILYDLRYQVDGVLGGDGWLDGHTSDNPSAPLIMVDYIYDYAESNGHDVYIILTIVMYFECTGPDMTLQADPVLLSEGENSTITATLTCGGTPMIGKTVYFDHSGPGEINPGSNSTNASGSTTATFTAGDDDAEITATYIACEFDNPQEVQKKTAVKVLPDQFNLSIDYQQVASYDDYYLEFSYYASITIERSDTALSGADTTDVTGSGSAGDCTMTIAGDVTFTVTGNIVVPPSGTPQLELTMRPDFNTLITTICPDDPPLINPFLMGGETSTFTLPMENGHIIQATQDTGVIYHTIIYVLTY